jgi:hypothetical protein
MCLISDPRFLAVDGLHGNNQISGEAQDVIWKLEACKVRIADHPGVNEEMSVYPY